MTEAENPRAHIGANNPPGPTPFELSRAEIDDLYSEAKNWFDGEPIATQEQADAVGSLLDKLRKAKNLADERRKDEAKPFDDAKAEIQTRYAPLIADTKAIKGKAILAEEACKKALVPFLQAKEAAQLAEARRLAEEAAEKQRAAQEAIQAAMANDEWAGASDLAEREAAEALIAEASQAATIANRADKAKTQARVAGGRAISLRTSYEPRLADMTVAARHYWKANPAVFEAFLIDLARKDIAMGKRDIPGFTIEEIRSAA